MDIHTITEEAITLLCQLIGTPRISRQETEAADLLQTFMTRHCGLDVCRSGNNLWTIAPGYDASRPTLLLNAHIDNARRIVRKHQIAECLGDEQHKYEQNCSFVLSQVPE